MLLLASVLAQSALGCTADMLDVDILQVSEQPYRCASMSMCGMTSENTEGTAICSQRECSCRSGR